MDRIGDDPFANYYGRIMKTSKYNKGKHSSRGYSPHILNPEEDDMKAIKDV